MSNILKVTTSIGGYDNSNTVKQNPQMQNPATNVQGPIRPDKVVRPDARSDASTQQDTNLQFKYETNFDNFIQQLIKAPILTQELPKIFQEYKAFLIESGIGENYAKEVDKFLSMIDMDIGKLQNFMKNQSDSAVRLSGSFFGVLKQIMDQTKSVELKTSILNFLKRYTDMAESDYILHDIKRNLDQISQRMFPNQREQLEKLHQKLAYTDNTPENTKNNLQALKEEILPFINEYISKTNERGVLRDCTALISQLIARYENGTQEGVQQSFNRMMDFQIFQRVFSNFDKSKLLSILSNTEFEKASKQNIQMIQLADIICKGAMGEAGIENKSAFQEILKAMILNESVYMPLLHFMVPVCYDGKLMFSELWIDPDSKEEKDKRENQKTVKGLVKFDIQDLGFFDMMFICSDNKVDMRLNIPVSLENDKNKIQEDIQRILSQHSLQSQQFVIGKSDVSIPITEVFDILNERKKSVNVSI